MDKKLYQIRIKKSEVNDYILGRISGMLDWSVYDGDRVKSTDVLLVEHEWIINCRMDHMTYLKIRDYITACYPNRKFKYFKFIKDKRIEV